MSELNDKLQFGSVQSLSGEFFFFFFLHNWMVAYLGLKLVLLVVICLEGLIGGALPVVE